MSTPRLISLRKLLAEHTVPAAAELVRPEDDGAVRCLACGHRCRVLPGRPGVCRVRFNDGGTLRVPHGYVASVAVDPIEKKPFYHAFPGRTALSFGMLGCDLHCSYCQNWITSQALRDDAAVAEPHFVTAAQLVELARTHACPVLTSTYNEPLITAEWAVEVFRRGREHDLVGSFVSNGNATSEALEYLRPHVDLYKVDLKSFDDRTYRGLGCALESVLDTIRRAKAMGFWVEVVTLVVPGLNDSTDELRRIAEFLAGVSPDIPWHVTAFHPDYKLTDPPRTPVETLHRAYELGRAAGLRFVYPGNLGPQASRYENTYCPACGTLAIERRGFSVLRNHLRDGRCAKCDALLPGVWDRRSLSSG
jgi:pyruvate formate lyase activating enzyme